MIVESVKMNRKIRKENIEMREDGKVLKKLDCKEMWKDKLMWDGKEEKGEVDESWEFEGGEKIVKGILRKEGKSIIEKDDRSSEDKKGGNSK